MAFELWPEITASEKFEDKATQSVLEKLFGAGVRKFSNPAHEEITNRQFGCADNGNDADCVGSNNEWPLSPRVIAGVRWNDNPPFLYAGDYGGCPKNLTERVQFGKTSKCWTTLFLDAKARAAGGFFFGPGYNLMARSHFGDLQFFHSMATRDMERAFETKQKIFMWAEYTWKLASREISPTTPLMEIPINGFRIHFKNGFDSKRLFALGQPVLHSQLDHVALGSLLHMLQDAFSKAHVERLPPTGEACPNHPQVTAPGKIKQFNTYAGQDSHAHSDMDTLEVMRSSLSTSANAVSSGKALIQMFVNGPVPWDTVKGLFDCFYTLSDENARSGPGSIPKR